MADPQVVLQLREVRKSYGGAVETKVLHGIDLELHTSEFAALIGPSGSGKSTLLNIIGLLDRPSSGTMRIGGEDASNPSEATRTRLRGRYLGFVFQFHHLIPALSAVENVMMPMSIGRGWLRGADRRRAMELLDLVGLAHKSDALPDALSGGQRQRIAIARALANHPQLVLADEPTGNLDTESSDQVFDLLRKINRERETAFLVVTHDPRIAARCSRVIELVDGRVVKDNTQVATSAL